MEARADTLFTRQRDVVPRERARELSVTIVGAGATGSWTALQLVKLGVEQITLIDGDRVELHNIGPQFHSSWDEGVYKAEALQEVLQRRENVEITAITSMLEADTAPRFGEVVFSCVDKMAVRRTIWDLAKKSRATKLVIDPRMAAEFCLIETGHPPADRRYEESIYPDGEAYEAPCGARSTAFAAGACACLGASIVARYLRGDVLPTHLELDLRNFVLQNPDLPKFFTKAKVEDEIERAPEAAA